MSRTDFLLMISCCAVLFGSMCLGGELRERRLAANDISTLEKAQASSYVLVAAEYHYESGKLDGFRQYQRFGSMAACDNKRFDFSERWNVKGIGHKLKDGTLQDFFQERFYRFGCWGSSDVGGKAFRAWLNAPIPFKQ